MSLVMLSVAWRGAHKEWRCRSEAAREALPEGHTQWALERCTVSEEGRPSCCSGQLQVCRRGYFLTELLNHRNNGKET